MKLVRLKRIALVTTGAWLAILLLPLASLSLFGASSFLSPTNIAFLFFLLVSTVAFVYTQRLPQCWRDSASIFLLAMCIWLSLSAFFGPHPTDELRGVVTSLGAVAFYYVGSRLAYKGGCSWTWETAIFVSALTAGVVGLLHYAGLLAPFAFEALVGAGRQIGDFQFSGGRYMGLISAPGDYDIWLLSGIMVAHRLFFREDIKLSFRFVIGVCALVMALADVISQSRSGWLTISLFLVVAWGGILVSKIRTPSSKAYVVGFVIIAGVIGINIMTISGIASAVGRAVVNVSDYSVLARFAGYSDAINTIVMHPVFGDGKVLAKFGRGDYIVHNAILAYMSSYGVMAGTLFVAFLIVIIRRCIMVIRRCRRHSHRRGDIVILAALVALLVSISLNPVAGSKVLFGVLGCISGSLGYAKARADID